MLFEKSEQVLLFVNYMNKRHKNIKFLFQSEKDNSSSFLDVRYAEKKINLEQAFSDKIRSLGYPIILVAL